MSVANIADKMQAGGALSKVTYRCMAKQAYNFTLKSRLSQLIGRMLMTLQEEGHLAWMLSDLHHPINILPNTLQHSLAVQTKPC